MHFLSCPIPSRSGSQQPLSNTLPQWEQLRLLIINGVDEGKQFEVTGAAIGLGRDAHNHVLLHDTEVSRRHAEILKSDQGFLLRDVGSANGTFVNNENVQETLIVPGDQIQIGQTTLLVMASHGSKARKKTGNTDLKDRISMITRQDVELSSAIVKTVAEGEGSRLLSNPQAVERPWLQHALVNLGILYELTQAISHIQDLDQLLDRVLELIFRSIEADRGCILIRASDSNRFEPRAIRWRTGTPPETEKIPVSSSIVEHVLKQKQGILVSDASADDRFKARQSIVRFGIQEVICVPMKGRHETIGVLYLDTQSILQEILEDVAQGNLNDPDNSDPLVGKFNEDHLSLAIAIAHQAALAVEETRYREKLIQSERLAAIGTTVAALSHHIKNILQGLRMGSDVLKMGMAEEPLDGKLIRQGWKTVEKNQGKIYDLVMDMLSYSKERAPAIEETNLNEVVKDVVELLQGKAKTREIMLGTRLGELPSCQVDPEGVHRAVLNIITNALDALEERRNPQVLVGTSVEDNCEWVRIIIADNGPGIAPEQIEDIFKPFHSTKGARGTGLGLAVSRKILREHGGDIHVQSQVNGGSRFTLRLPVKNSLALEGLGSNPNLPALDLEDDASEQSKE